jgi:ATP-dependent Lon protease
MASRQTLPVLPLRGTVIFPGITAPIAAGRPATLRAIEAAIKGDRLVFAVAQRDNADEPTPEILYSTGVIARIGQVQRGLGGVQLLLQGEERATAWQELLRFWPPYATYQARVEREIRVFRISRR